MLPERHVDTFRNVSEFPADEAKRLLEFVAEVARGAGLHFHVLGGRISGMPA